MKPPDLQQWDGVTEDSLFLNDGLLRVADLISVPPDICSGQTNPQLSWSTDSSSDTSSAQLAKEIEEIYCYRSSCYQRYQDYRLCALKGYWEAQKSVQKVQPIISNSCSFAKSLDKQNLPFTSRISLLLIFPLLEVQSVSNPELCKQTIKLLRDCLKDCETSFTLQRTRGLPRWT